jgi:hypothetical protein
VRFVASAQRPAMAMANAFILNSIDPDLPSGSFSHYRERPPIGWANVEWA